MAIILGTYLVMNHCPNVDTLEELPVLETLRESSDQWVFSFTQLWQ